MIKNLLLLAILSATVGLSGCGMAQSGSEADDQRFLSLATSLESYTEANRIFNFEREDIILRSIYDQMLRGDQRNTLLKNDMDENKAHAAEIYLELENAKDILKKIGGVALETGEWGNPAEHKETQNYLLGNNPEANQSHGEGFAKKIRSQINAYAEWANELLAKLNKETSRPAKTNHFPTPIKDPEYGAKSWEHESFLGASAAAAYAELTRLEMEVALVEAEVLDYFSSRTKLNWGTEINLVVLESTEERTVDAGKEFAAQFRLGEVHSTSHPEYLTDGKVEQQPDGSVVIRWKANRSPETNEKGLGVRPYSIEVKVPTSAGTARSIIHKGEFYIRQ